MMTHKSKVEAAKEVKLVVVQGSSAIFLVPNGHLMGEKAAGTCKRPLQNFYLCLQST